MPASRIIPLIASLSTCAAAFQSPNVTLQGCLDINCPLPPDHYENHNKEAECSVASSHAADASLAEDVLSVPNSDIKLSIGVTRGAPIAGKRLGLNSGHMLYEYDFWLVQPDSFDLETGEEGGRGEVPQVCGFFLQHAFQTFPPFQGSYSTPSDENSEVNLPNNSTECRGTVLREECMQSIEDMLQDIEVDSGNGTSRCDAMALELQTRIQRDSECGFSYLESAITVTGTTILGERSNDTPLITDDAPDKDSNCFRNRVDSSSTLIQAESLAVLESKVWEDEDGETPDVPPETARGYIPLITTELDEDGKVAGNASFICLRTLDQVYWKHNGAGALLASGGVWVGLLGMLAMLVL